jgi:hypothetical protein
LWDEQEIMIVNERLCIFDAYFLLIGQFHFSLKKIKKGVVVPFKRQQYPLESIAHGEARLTKSG